MLFRNLDDDHDWCFGKGLEDLTTGDTAIGLNIETRILSWVGDCFWDMEAGIDWSNRIGGKNVKELLDLELRRLIIQSQEVTGLVDFVITQQGRNFTAAYTVNTIYGSAYASTINIER